MAIGPRFPPLKWVSRSCAIGIKCILGLRRTYVPHVVVFTFRVKCYDVRYDFHIKTMFNSSFPPVVCRRLISYLRYLCLFPHSGFHHILCCVFVLFFFVLCTLCRQFLFYFYLNLKDNLQQSLNSEYLQGEVASYLNFSVWKSKQPLIGPQPSHIPRA